jgi:hypothetical protein
MDVPFIENVSPKAGIVRSRYQAATSEDTAGWKRLTECSTELKSLEINDGAVIKCNYELCV